MSRLESLYGTCHDEAAVNAMDRVSLLSSGFDSQVFDILHHREDNHDHSSDNLFSGLSAPLTNGHVGHVHIKIQSEWMLALVHQLSLVPNQSPERNDLLFRGILALLSYNGEAIMCQILGSRPDILFDGIERVTYRAMVFLRLTLDFVLE